MKPAIFNKLNGAGTFTPTTFTVINRRDSTFLYGEPYWYFGVECDHCSAVHRVAFDRAQMIVGENIHGHETVCPNCGRGGIIS